MTSAKREDIIAAMSSLLEQLVDSEPPKAEPTTAAPEKVEMLTIKECTEAVKGLNEYTVRQLIARKEIPSIRTGQGKRGKILVPKAALLRYFAGA
ncbi:MAG: helix-turn-helix domain-containing protein [Oscillospiraceae bacterium]|nr:helix-turn-helix domain-containing protein [Oscillospiraceae bacterium]